MHTSNEHAGGVAQHPGTARDRILRTAHDLFYAHGIRATGIDRVIAEAGVTKVTFYRQFPSKSELILAYLHYRHASWIDWFSAALARHGGDIEALVPSIGEWLKSEGFRGCAFINVVGELSEELPEVVDIARAHKADMAQAIAGLLPAGAGRKATSQALALAVDGAIVQAQMGMPIKQVQAGLDSLCKGLAPRP